MATTKSTKRATKRVKNKTPLPLPCSGWSEADEYLRRLGAHQRQIDAAQLRAANKIAAIQDKLKVETAEPMAAAQLLVFSLENFVAGCKSDFEGARSKKLHHGVVGWRKATSIKITKQTKTKEGTLSLIKQFFAPSLRKACLIVKESVDKEALHKLTDEQLATVAAQRMVTDDFYVEPTSVKAAEIMEDAGDV